MTTADTENTAICQKTDQGQRAYRGSRKTQTSKFREPLATKEQERRTTAFGTATATDPRQHEHVIENYNKTLTVSALGHPEAAPTPDRHCTRKRQGQAHHPPTTTILFPPLLQLDPGWALVPTQHRMAPRHLAALVIFERQKTRGNTAVAQGRGGGGVHHLHHAAVGFSAVPYFFHASRGVVRCSLWVCLRECRCPDT